MTPYAEAQIRKENLAVDEPALPSQHATKTNNTFDLFQLYDDEFEVTADGENINLENCSESDVIKRLISNELREYTYLEVKAISDEDLLSWWRQHAQELPLLSTLAKSIFAIPAGSASVESNFSTAGLILTDRRTNLHPQKLEYLLICGSNNDIKYVEHLADDNNQND